MSLFDLSGNRTKKEKDKLEKLSDDELRRISDGSLKDSDALFQEFVGIRSKKVVVQTAAYQLLRERDYKRRKK